MKRPVLRFPPENELPALPPCKWNEMPEYPSLMTQWPWGVQGYWNEENSTIIIQEKLSSDFNIENSDGPLIEIRVDGLEFDLGRTELAWGWFWDGSDNRRGIFDQLMQNRPSPDLNFWLTDYAIEDMTAAARAYQVINTKPQEHLIISQSVQVIDDAGYMKYFNLWKQTGINAVCQQYEAQFSDPHYLCDLFVGRMIFERLKKANPLPCGS